MSNPVASSCTPHAHGEQSPASTPGPDTCVLGTALLDVLMPAWRLPAALHSTFPLPWLIPLRQALPDSCCTAPL